jgi:ABC-type glycerol-3-phosphate transport system permease component
MANTLRPGRLITDTLLYALLIGVCLFMILPFIWMTSTSFKPPEEIFTSPPIIISEHATLRAYQYLLDHYDLIRIVLNTFFIAIASTAVQLFFCALAGFGFAKYKFPGQNGLFAFLLATMIIPFTVIMVPLFVIIRDLAWIDKFQAIIIPTAANAFGIFFMRQYISSVSNELLDAARIDGANEFTIFWRVVLPIVAPGLTSLGLIIFMNSWNNFLWPLVVLKSNENFTLPLLISSMGGPAGSRTVYDIQMATSIISIIPLLIIFLIFQRRFVEGIQAGAIRG